MAACGTRAAGQAADHRVLGHERGFVMEWHHPLLKAIVANLLQA
jgi:hypothetical protein